MSWLKNKLKTLFGIKPKYSSLLEEITALKNENFPGLTKEQKSKLNQIEKELPKEVFVDLCKNSSYSVILEYYDFYKKGAKINKVK